MTTADDSYNSDNDDGSDGVSFGVVREEVTIPSAILNKSVIKRLVNVQLGRAYPGNRPLNPQQLAELQKTFEVCPPLYRNHPILVTVAHDKVDQVLDLQNWGFAFVIQVII
jgi:hypothetical protein